jgi:bifunctional UDP-N-acetylglucosamine pyrophosphorylase/glucosamine-1-phosphate N-acetyltransferase
VIRRSVPPGALAMSVSTQRNVEGWVEANREGTPSADAASQASHGKK